MVEIALEKSTLHCAAQSDSECPFGIIPAARDGAHRYLKLERFPISAGRLESLLEYIHLEGSSSRTTLCNALQKLATDTAQVGEVRELTDLNGKNADVVSERGSSQTDVGVNAGAARSPSGERRDRRTHKRKRLRRRPSSLGIELI